MDFIFNKDTYKFKSGLISYNKTKVSFSGEINEKKNIWINLKFSSDKAYINDLAEFFPVQLENFRKNYALAGYSAFSGSIKGFSTQHTIPDVHVNFIVQNALINNRNNKRKATDIFLKGNYSLIKSEHSLNLSEFNSRIGDSHFQGEMSIKGFDSPAISINMKSDIRIKEFVEFLNVDTLEELSGSLQGDLKLQGTIPSLKNFNYRDLFALKREGEVTAKDISFKIAGSNYHSKHEFQREI
ncbi:MAG: hypothetical protein HC906_03850 [Bacteroidales bacterium]|nr:hypothetical protein [Bacteroidales bacterium]